MRIEELQRLKKALYQIATKHGIGKLYVFGSVARHESGDSSDVDFLIEMNESYSALGVGAFQYEVQQLLGINIDVIPTFALERIRDREFVKSVQSEAIAL